MGFMNKVWLIVGGLLALCAVAFGAIGDHSIQPQLRKWFPDDAEKRISDWEVACRYLFYHALAICLVGLLPKSISRTGVQVTGWLFCLGILLFSGCLFAYTVTNQKWFASGIPFGGAFFLLGWIAFVFVVARANPSPN